jgi:AraC-like DNA-binding protein
MRTAPRFLNIGRVDPDPNWQMATHSHRFHQLIVILAGTLHVTIRGQTLPANAGELLWYPAGVPHQEQSDRRKPCETLFLSWEGVNAPDDGLPLHQPDTQGRVTELSRWLLAERSSHYPDRQALRDSLLHAILAEYRRLATHKEAALVVHLRAHIRQHLTQPLTLNQLAGVAGLSKFHLVRRYRQLTGRTPMGDVRHIRLQTARDLLLTTNLPLKEIAPRCGLRDEFHLSRLYRQLAGHTPGQLRRR